MDGTSTLLRKPVLFTNRAACFLLLLLFVNNFNGMAQAPPWQWAVGASSPTFCDVEGWLVKADGAGHVYTTGLYYGDSVNFGGLLFTNTAGAAMYLVKYDSNGAVMWAQQSGGGFGPEPRGLAVDAAGNVLVSGLFSDTISFGGIQLIEGGTGTDACLVKYDPNGNVLWALRAGGPGREWGEGVATDASGNVFLTGAFESDTLTIGTYTLVNYNQAQVREDVYLAKFDPSGNVLWAKQSGGMNNEWSTSVATDPFGNVYICGPYFSSAMSFGTDSLVSPHGDNHDQNFVASYDPAGNYRWSRQVTLTANAYDSYLYDVATDAFGNVFVSGDCNSDTVFLDTVLLIDLNPGRDMIVAKYDSGGVLMWARRPTGTSGSEYGFTLSVDASGSAYVAGYFDSDSIVFDAGNTLAVDQWFYSDLFIAKYHPDGHVIWSKDAGGIYLPGSWGYHQVGITSDPDGRVFAGGCFLSDSMYFGQDTVLAGNNYPNIFVAMLDDAGFCSAAFGVYPDSTTPHLYWVLNQASGTAPLSYLWQWGDGSTDTVAYPTHTYATGGFYPLCLTITDSTGCTNTVCHTWNLLRMSQSATMVQVNVVSSLPTGTSNIFSGSINIWPNPSTSDFRVDCNSFGAREYEIYDVTGKRVAGVSLAGNTSSFSIDASAWEKGFYFLQVRGDGWQWAGKLIRQ